MAVENIKFPNGYSLWVHDLHDDDWTLGSYMKICNIADVDEFWKVYKNFDKVDLKNVHYFLMKEGIDPVWEHVDNRNGGMCSFKVPMSEILGVWEFLCASMICEKLKLNGDSYDINGISMSPKNDFSIVKIWNRNSKNDLSRTLSGFVSGRLGGYSIKYRANAPEY